MENELEGSDVVMSTENGLEESNSAAADLVSAAECPEADVAMTTVEQEIAQTIQTQNTATDTYQIEDGLEQTGSAAADLVSAAECPESDVAVITVEQEIAETIETQNTATGMWSNDGYQTPTTDETLVSIHQQQQQYMIYTHDLSQPCTLVATTKDQYNKTVLETLEEEGSYFQQKVNTVNIHDGNNYFRNAKWYALRASIVSAHII